MSRNLLIALTLFAAPALLAAAQSGSRGLEKEKEILLEGGTSFDLVSVDSGAQRLYVAHSPNIDVIDLTKGQKIGEVASVEGAHQAIAVGDLHRGFASSGAKNRLIVFNTESFKVEKEIETGQ